ncbi:MAG TPA: type II toxin-antitoxin system HicA family toxin [bacterium]|nr:type II toxin-antitoxin system HicA family toxin [bacterium]HPR89543.1 type II toxin-antitoxin system HicA family toxin [bacterium]
MPELPAVKPRAIIKALQKAGFVLIRTKGSHYQLRKANLLVTVPVHNRDLQKSTLSSILRQARITVEELQSYL